MRRRPPGHHPYRGGAPAAAGGGGRRERGRKEGVDTNAGCSVGGEGGGPLRPTGVAGEVLHVGSADVQDGGGGGVPAQPAEPHRRRARGGTVVGVSGGGAVSALTHEEERAAGSTPGPDQRRPALIKLSGPSHKTNCCAVPPPPRPTCIARAPVCGWRGAEQRGSVAYRRRSTLGRGETCFHLHPISPSPHSRNTMLRLRQPRRPRRGPISFATPSRPLFATR